MTGLYWLASSERERQQAYELARALQQKESRDELGIGTVRDALADLLFPGTSTLHTRARYHLFIPWAYRYAAHSASSSSFPNRVRNIEAQLIGALRDSGDTRGLIGQQAGAALKRMPSTLYWQGLHVWGIRRTSGPPSVVARLMTRQRRAAIRNDDGELLDAPANEVWHRNLPPTAPGFPNAASFELTRDEADFLAERLHTEPATRGTALAQLIDISADHARVDQVWMHPFLGTLTDVTQRTVDQGRRFSLLMHGATWIYNVVLACMQGDDELEEVHRDAYATWASLADEAGPDLTAWHLDELWTVTGGRVSYPARHFVTRWQRLVREHGAATLVDREDARSLIIERERTMKGAAARTVNEKALDQWGGGSALAPLDFRWSTARGLISDIRASLENADAED